MVAEPVEACSEPGKICANPRDLREINIQHSLFNHDPQLVTGNWQPMSWFFPTMTTDQTGCHDH
jgi:hypothetical protein